MSTEEKNNALEEYAAMRARAGKTRRRLLIVLGVVFGVILLLLGAVLLIGKLTEPKGDVPDYGFEFYPPYEGNIMEDAAYLELDRSISYCADPSGYGLTQTVTDENRQDMGVEVRFLCGYLQAVIDGDHAAYNAMLSPAYIEKEGKQAAFSQQMLYEMKINFMNERREGDDRLVTYRLSYMIHRNDGSFRRDMESDAARPQDLTLRVSPDGQILIEEILTYHSKK